MKHKIFEVNYRKEKFKVVLDNIWYGKKYWLDLINNKNEPITFNIFDKYSSKDVSFLDLGAAIGLTSIYASYKFKDVLAVEPNKDVLWFLNKNIKINNIRNIKVLNGCVGIENKKIIFEKGDNFNEIVFTKIKKQKYHINSYQISNLFLKIKNKKIFIKIDIEGFEFNLLNNDKFISNINTKKPMIFLSIHHGASPLLKYNRYKLNFLHRFLNLTKTFEEYKLILKLFKIYKYIYIDEKRVSKYFFLNLKYYRKDVDIFFHK